MSEKGRPLPKFGEWDDNDPASAEGFTVIFNKARDEKKTGGKPESPTKMDINARHGVEPLKPQDFKYQNDSVLVVSSADYLNCNTANPISKFENGNSVFQFDHSGFFYFTSGQPGHCKSGQRLIVRVMHPSEIGVPSPAPSPADGADGGGSDYSDWGPPAGVNSGIELGAVSFYTIGLCGLLYLSI